MPIFSSKSAHLDHKFAFFVAEQFHFFLLSPADLCDGSALNAALYWFSMPSMRNGGIVHLPQPLFSCRFRYVDGDSAMRNILQFIIQKVSVRSY